GEVALVAYDVPYPFPLSVARPIAAQFAVALLLSARPRPQSLAVLSALELADGDADAMSDPALERLRAGVPAARALPLLAAIAGREPAQVRVGMLDGQRLQLRVAPCA